jgi:biogenesis of lysosome-related organelles complex 1 subunit KXD1
MRANWLTKMENGSSGKLNAKQRELMDLQKQAQARLARTRERFQEGMRDAREVRSDLEWTQKKVS